MIKPKEEKYYDTEKAREHYYIQDMYDESMKKAKEYADKYGADYHCITTEEYRKDVKPTWQRFAIWNSDYDKYDNIIYCDADYVWVPENAPNLFEIMNKSEHCFFARKENNDPTKKVLPKLKKKLGLPDDYMYFNAGFFGITREGINKLKPFVDKYVDQNMKSQWFDQDALNTMIYNELGEYGILSRHWNGIMATKLPLFGVHYCSITKQQFTVEKHKKLIAEKIARAKTVKDLNNLVWLDEEPAEEVSLEGFFS